MEEICDDDLLPNHLSTYSHNYLLTWDIETLEQKVNIQRTESMRIEANQYLVSIGCSSNLPNAGDKWFCRKSSAPEEGHRVVGKFINHLRSLQNQLLALIPQEITDLIEKLEEESPQETHQFVNSKKHRYLRHLQKLCELNCYGFNSGKYDLPAMIASVYKDAFKNKHTVSALKKANKYTMVKIGDLCFKDVLSFTAPCSLSQYLRQWGAEEEKSVFPYQLYSRVEELVYAESFPEYEQFYSTLKAKNVAREDYDKARDLFNNRKSLPPRHPDHIGNMKDFLRYYNLLDVRPLVQAVVNSFNAFKTHFNVEPNVKLSLPSLAFDAMFEQYDQKLPLSYSLTDEPLRQLFRANVLGGLTTVSHRHINLENEFGPHNAKYAPNGERFTNVSFWDFNRYFCSVFIYLTV